MNFELREKSLPNAKTQKYLGYIGTIGVLTACFGCGLAANNQMRASQIFLIVAWFILVPLFGYLISARRHIKKVVRTRNLHRQEELDALAMAVQESGRRSQESIDVEDEGRRTKDEDVITKKTE